RAHRQATLRRRPERSDDRARRTVRAGGLHLFFFKQKTAYEIGLGIPAEPLFRSSDSEQLTKNQAVATSQEAVQNQNEPQLRDENAHNDKSVHGVLNPTYQAGLRRDAVQPDIEAEQIGRASCRERV